VSRPRVRLRSSIPALALLGALAPLGGCVPLPGGRTFERRTVAGKRGDDTLVALDGGTCRVWADVFARVQVGDEHACVWRDVGSGRPGSHAAPEPQRPSRGLPGRAGGG
jgi:hypothetical protein